MGVVANYASDGRKLVTHLWYLILGFVSIFFIGCIVVAAQRNIRPETNKSAGFAAIWSMFVVLFTSIYGQMTLTTWQTSFHVGILLGLCTMLTQFNLTLFVLFTSFSERSNLDGDGLVAAFSFFLFLLYGVFTTVLLKHRALVSNDGPNLPPTPQQAYDGSTSDIKLEAPVAV